MGDQIIKSEYIDSVSRSGLFKYLNKKDHERAWSELLMASRPYSDEQLILSQGEPVKRAGIVHQGTVRGEKLCLEGTSHVAYVYSKGEVFAFEGAVSGMKTSPLDFTAQGETTVIFFDVMKIFGGSFEKQLITGLMELLANDNIKKLYRIETLSQRRLRDRILTHLNIMSRKNGSDTFTLEMSREQLARYLCVNRTALSYELNQMKRDGLIDFRGKTFRIK
ncbi:MAG TPA: Crp/Fnr family transcriptional regulator [Candidatus Copromorpha excrementigallinarum]|uniref:Crp/Fnr family transcriptional regulator n=1 Tax=Candidatus Allocopromorpha excrementigallinarum TaxID=2840742 RepID=A0A9D1L5B3_9FIRM|nr:Crp/Fnr family transcriptional regulator [Candidatus Copromorpha excrementigallinarum]